MSKKGAPATEYIQEYRERIGSKIREIREKRKLSQDELAALMDVNRSTISKVENGKFAITIDYLVRFGWVLDFDIIILEK